MTKRITYIVLVLLLLLVFVSLFAFINQNKLIDRFIRNESEDQQPRKELLAEDGVFRLVTVGTGAPLPNNHRVGACQAVFVNGQFLLFNVGPGAMRAMQRQRLPIDDVDALFFSNLEDSKILDLVELESELTKSHVSNLRAYGPSSMSHLQLDTLLWQQNEINNDQCQLIYNESLVQVTACPLSEDPITFGYRIDYQDHELVIGSNVTDTLLYVELAEDADYILQEAYDHELLDRIASIQSEEGFLEYAALIQKAKKHTINKYQAARLAERAGTPKLIFTHLGPSPENPISRSFYRSGIDDIYKGSVILAEDGDLFTIQ